MPVRIIIGAVLMTTALVLYSVGIIDMLRHHRARVKNAVLLGCASASDLSGTFLMISYAGSFLPADWHGWFGYCALALMLVNLGLVIGLAKKGGRMPAWFCAFDLCIYVIWILSYLQGFVKL